MTAEHGAAPLGPEAGAVLMLPCGPDAVLGQVASTAVATELYAAARSSLPPRLAPVELVPGARTVLFDGVPDAEGLRRWLTGWQPAGELIGGPTGGSTGAAAARTVEVPTRYDGEDLDDVARRWGMSRTEAVATHAGLRYTVAFCGFAPGFAYCAGLPAELAVPRLDEPRRRVPAGSVALADAFTGVYPTSSPGGWRLVGRTAVTLWDAEADEPALPTPGTRVRFVPVTSADEGGDAG